MSLYYTVVWYGLEKTPNMLQWLFSDVGLYQAQDAGQTMKANC